MKGPGAASLVKRNLLRRPVRALILVTCVASASGMQVAAGLIERGAELGYELSLKRLGADLVAVPDEFTDALERAYLTGSAALFYMDSDVEERIAGFDFVEETSSQLYVKSLSGAPCCSAGNIFLIGFEPDTDFTVRPWLDGRPDREIGPDDALVGAAFPMKDGDTIRFFGHMFTVAGVLEETGSGLDATVFIPLETAYLMAEESAEKAVQTLPIARNEISAVMVSLKPEEEGGIPIDKANYELTRNIYEISAYQPHKMIKKVQGNLAATVYGLRAAGLASWPMTMLLIGLVFAMAVRERGREIGLLRAMGASRRFVFAEVTSEALILSAAGALAGSAAAAALVSAFGRHVALTLEVPFMWPGAAQAGGFLAMAFALAVLGGAAAGAVPAYAISAMDPYEAARAME